MAFGFLKKAVKSVGKAAGNAVKGSVQVAVSPGKFAVDVAKGKNVVKSARKMASTPVNVAARAVRDVGNVGKSIPLAGRGVSAALAPAKMITDIAQGRNVVKSVKTGIKTPFKAAAGDVKMVAKGAAKIPVLGKGISAAVTVGAAPVLLANAVASGERIDQAILKNLKTQVRAIKDISPYARTIVSLVPGVGTGAAAAIAAGAALAEGQSISASLVSGVTGAIPGGGLATATFNAGMSALGGSATASAQLKSLGLNAAQKKNVTIVLDQAKRLAQGAKINTKASVSAKAALPKEIRSALDIGIALGYAQKKQASTKKQVTPAVLNNLSAQGKAIAATNSVVKAGMNRIKNPKTAAGYSVGAAVAAGAVGDRADRLAAISANLRPDEQRGFEIAMAENIGMSEEEIPEDIRGNADAEFAFAVTMGAQTMSEPAREALIESMAQDPALVPGIEAAAKSLTLGGRFKAFIKRVIAAIKGK